MCDVPAPDSGGFLNMFQDRSSTASGYSPGIHDTDGDGVEEEHRRQQTGEEHRTSGPEAPAGREGNSPRIGRG